MKTENKAIEYIKKGYTLINNQKVRIGSNIDLEESSFIYDFIKTDRSIKKVLEIGCANGVSSLTISSALNSREGSFLTIIDPHQEKMWKNAGKRILEESSFENFKLIYDFSENILPKEKENKYDLIFIDGWHTFDQVMLDIFYSIRLVKLNGYIIIDDADSNSVGKAISYYKKYPNIKYFEIFKRNYKNLSLKRKLANIIKYILNEFFAQIILPKFIFDKFFYQLNPTLILFQKIGNDERKWNYHKIF
jgi:predicted O-methyltransferase YrrM